jgi:hypothetical protein
VISPLRTLLSLRQRPGRPASAEARAPRRGAQSNAGMRVLIVGTENILDNLYYGPPPLASLALPYP